MSSKPHAVCMPFPEQGHINGMLKLAKVLYCKGFHITFVNSEHNHRRIIKSRGPAALQGFADFKFESIPDGLPRADDVDCPRDVQLLCASIQNDCLIPFRQLVSRLNEMDPPVTCIISDTITSFTLQVAAELQIPDVFFNSASACGYMSFLHYDKLVQTGILPLKDETNLTKGYLDTPIDEVPGLKNMRMRDLPNFMQFTSNPDDILFNFIKHEGEQISRATTIVNNTFWDLEGPVLDAMSLILPPIYAIGPLPLLSRQLIQEKSLMELSLNLWKEDQGCLKWVEGKQSRSVLYVNFGSGAVMTNQQLIELAWGLANSGYDFLWVIRPDLVRGDSAILPLGFLSETRGRSMLASWCPQEEVLHHPAIGGFLTHCGWNSSMESICCGVPMICWPFFGDQLTNCRYLCAEWGVGMEMGDEVTRENVTGLLRDLMEGEKGKEMRKNALKWKESAIRATQPGGSSFTSLDMLISEVILQKTSL